MTINKYLLKEEIDYVSCGSLNLVIKRAWKKRKHLPERDLNAINTLMDKDYDRASEKDRELAVSIFNIIFDGHMQIEKVTEVNHEESFEFPKYTRERSIQELPKVATANILPN